jgi:iron-sulfur cluster repair protein YtfE (RIC family)
MPVTTSKVRIPESVQVEHAAIHSMLVEATRAPGRVGVAARALAEVLHPHFVREEEIALPPLGLLAALAAGERLEDADVSAVLAMTDALRSELPRMLEEHKGIRAAVDALRLAAREAQSPRYEQLADQLAVHAQNEEEVLYPAAILVGDLIRTRRGPG